MSQPETITARDTAEDFLNDAFEATDTSVRLEYLLKATVYALFDVADAVREASGGNCITIHGEELAFVPHDPTVQSTRT